MSSKSLSIAYAVRRQSKGLGPIPAIKAEAAPELPDIVEETEDAAQLPEPVQSTLDRVMAKHRNTFEKLAKNEN